jgi:hypothetical protein
MKENNTTKQQRLTNEKHKNMKENNTTKQQRLTNVKKAKPHKNMILIRNTRETCPIIICTVKHLHVQH